MQESGNWWRRFFRTLVELGLLVGGALIAGAYPQQSLAAASGQYIRACSNVPPQGCGLSPLVALEDLQPTQTISTFAGPDNYVETGMYVQDAWDTNAWIIWDRPDDGYYEFQRFNNLAWPNSGGGGDPDPDPDPDPDCTEDTWECVDKAQFGKVFAAGFTLIFACWGMGKGISAVLDVVRRA